MATSKRRVDLGRAYISRLSIGEPARICCPDAKGYLSTSRVIDAYTRSDGARVIETEHSVYTLYTPKLTLID